MNKIVNGKVEKKFPYQGTNDKAPAGHIIFNGLKFTCWSQTLFDQLEEDKEYKLEYSEKENEYMGESTLNRNLVGFYREEFEELSDEVNQKLKDVGKQMDKIKEEKPDSTPLEVAEKLTSPEVLTGETTVRLGGKDFIIKFTELK